MLKYKCRDCGNTIMKKVCNKCNSDNIETSDWKAIPMFFSGFFAFMSFMLIVYTGVMFLSTFTMYFAIEKMSIPIQFVLGLSTFGLFYLGILQGKKERKQK